MNMEKKEQYNLMHEIADTIQDLFGDRLDGRNEYYFCKVDDHGFGPFLSVVILDRTEHDLESQRN